MTLSRPIRLRIMASPPGTGKIPSRAPSTMRYTSLAPVSNLLQHAVFRAGGAVIDDLKADEILRNTWPFGRRTSSRSRYRAPLPRRASACVHGFHARSFSSNSRPFVYAGRRARHPFCRRQNTGASPRHKLWGIAQVPRASSPPTPWYPRFCPLLEIDVS